MMPVLTSPEIAVQFTERWRALHPEDRAEDGIGSVYQDESLTSLQWLQDFSILSATLERPPSRTTHNGHQTSQPHSPPAGDTAVSSVPLLLGGPITSSASAGSAQVDYRTNPHLKPPHSYATLICMAMQASKQTKITLSAIYSWITDNFCYYKHAEPSWQNSIRHNLSLNKCFMKVPRQKDEPGKGGFWQIDPQYADMFVNGVFKRRRMPSTHFGGQRQSKALSVPKSSGQVTIQQQQCGPQVAIPTSQVWHHESHRRTGMGTKRKQASPKRGGKCVRSDGSVLPGIDGREMGALKGDFNWASPFDDISARRGNTFEDLDINVALDSLGCEPDTALLGHHPATGGQWRSTEADRSGGYMEMSGMPGGSAHDTQAHLEELFLEQPHHWEVLKEEATPLTLDHSFGFCEGFLTDVQPWERAESYL